MLILGDNRRDVQDRIDHLIKDGVTYPPSPRETLMIAAEKLGLGTIAEFAETNVLAMFASQRAGMSFTDELDGVFIPAVHGSMPLTVPLAPWAEQLAVK